MDVPALAALLRETEEHHGVYAAVPAHRWSDWYAAYILVAALAVHLMTDTALTGATSDIDGGQQLVAAGG